MIKKIIATAFTVLFALGITGCDNKGKTPADVIRVGTIAGPETSLMEVAKRYAKECYGLTIKIVTFSDYNIPNMALNDGSIDANMFQHLPFLKMQNRQRGYKIMSVGETFVYPMGIYSKEINHLKELKPGDTVAIPNDPSNEMRALLLLQKAGLIRLHQGTTVLGTLSDIRSNPKKLKFIALDAAQLPRSLKDVTVAVINTNFAIPAGLHPSTALAQEGPDSPYANIVAVRMDNIHLPKVQELVASLHSKPVLEAAKRIFGDGAIPAWNTKEPVYPPCKKEV